MEIYCTLWFSCVVIFLSKSDGEVYPSIQWNPYNPIFKLNYTLSVLPTSKMNLVCPNAATVMAAVQDNTPKEQLHENLWVVDKGSYDNCTVNTRFKSNRLLVKCDEPLNLKYFPLVFQQYSATERGLEFAPGGDYYFIATSDGTKKSLDNKSGGHCKTRNMRIKIHVCSNVSDSHCIGTTPTSSPKITTSRLLISSPKIRSRVLLPTTVATEPEVEVHGNHNGKNLVNKRSQHGNKTAGNESEFDDGHPEVFAELKYQLAIGFLLAIVLVLLLLTTLLCFRFHQKLDFCGFNRRKSSQTTVSDAPSVKHRNSTASTKQILGVRFSGISQIDGSSKYNVECELSSE